MKRYVACLLIICTIIVAAIISGCKTPGDKNPEAQYYNVVYSAGDGGTISGEASQTVEEGKNSTEVVAVPNTGYKFVRWSDGVETAERTEINVTADISVTATFEKLIYTIKYLTSGDGYISGLETQTLRYGNDASRVTAVPGRGYRFVKWSDGIETSQRTDRNVMADLTVTAIFERFENFSYTVKYLTDGNGYIVGKASQSVEYGGNAAKVTAIPNNGYKFVKWSDGLISAERTDKNITADRTLIAIFEKSFTYSLNYKTDGNGYIAGKASQSVEQGGNAASVTAVPNNGYKFVKWSDGATDEVRQDLNVKQSLTVTAEFEFLFAGGEGYSDNPFIIENYQQLLNMRFYRNRYYKLADDLDLEGISHEPIFDSDVPFSGKFDGNEKTIINLTVLTEKNYPSLFGYITNGTVTDLNLQNVDIKTIDFNTEEADSNYLVGTVAGYMSGIGTISNVSVDGEITVDELTYDGLVVGGLVGRSRYSPIVNCDINVQITAKNIRREHPSNLVRPFIFGGLSGVCESASIKDCIVQGEINISESCNYIYVGGIVDCYWVKSGDKEIRNSQTNVLITSDNIYHHIGGFIENIEMREYTSLQVTGCSVQGNITGGKVGGFIYEGDCFGDDLLIENCFVENEIKECSDAAGFIYEFSGGLNSGTIRSCHAICNIVNYNQIGYAYGFSYSLRYVNLIDCFSSGSASASYAGGFARMIIGCYIECCYSDSSIDTVMPLGAFAYALLNSEMINCYSQNTFINEPTQNDNSPLSVIMNVVRCKVSNFYYSGNAIEKVFRGVSDSQIINFHCLKSDRMTSDSGYDGVTVYENAQDMFGIADLLNDGLTENVWVNQENDFPKLKAYVEI